MSESDKPLPGIKTEVIHLRVDPDMHQALKAWATAQPVTVTTAIRMLLRKQLKTLKAMK